MNKDAWEALQSQGLLQPVLHNKQTVQGMQAEPGRRALPTVRRHTCPPTHPHR